MGSFKQLLIVSQIFAQIVSKKDSNNLLKKTFIAKSSKKDDFHSILSRRWIFLPISNIVRGIYGTLGKSKLFFYDFKVKTKSVTFT